MKTSLVLVVLIILNTSALLSTTLAQLVSGIDTWILVTLEVFLLLIFYGYQSIKGLDTLSQIDLKANDFFVVNQKDKSQEES